MRQSNKPNRKKTVPKKKVECYLYGGPHKFVSPTKKTVNKLLAGEPKAKKEFVEGAVVISAVECHGPAVR